MLAKIGIYKKKTVVKIPNLTTKDIEAYKNIKIG